MQFELGVTAKDKITGFKGILTGYASYITGCDQYLLAPKAKKDGSVGEGKWYDENRLEVMKVKKVTLKTGKGTNDNGACEAAPVK